MQRQHQRAEHPAVSPGAQQPAVLADLLGSGPPDRFTHESMFLWNRSSDGESAQDQQDRADRSRCFPARKRFNS